MEQKKNDGAVMALLNIPAREPETTQVQINRLGLELTLRELGYDRLCALREGEDAEVSYVLASIAAPNVRDARWYQEHMGCPTPADALKKLLKPGEIVRLAKLADRLNGYGAGAVTAVKLDAEELQAQAVAAAVEDLEKN